MAGKGGIFTVLILVIAALAVAGCDVPVGGGGVGSIAGSGVYYGLLVKPIHATTYSMDEPFKRTDLEVYAITSEGKEQLLETGYRVFVIDDVKNPSVESDPIDDKPYPFTSAGEKAIRVRYDRFLYQYRIDVLLSGSQDSGILVGWETTP